MAKAKMIKKKVVRIKRDNCASKTKRREVIKYLQAVLQEASTHGLTYLLNTKQHCLERAFWIINFVGAFVLMMFLLSAQYTRYTNTPIVMSVEKDYFNWNVSYPAFTLCPQNNNKLDNYSLKMIGKELQRKTTVDLSSIQNFLQTLVSISLENLQEIDYEKLTSLQVYFDPKDYARLAAQVFMKFDPTALTTSTNRPISVDTVITELGMCHVINSNVATFDDALKWNNNITTYSKNNVELTFHDRDFFAQITKYSDVYKIYIHDPDDVVLVTTSPYTYEMHALLTLGVKVWTFTTSEELRSSSTSLRKCRYKHEPISERYPIYSYTHCLLECRITMIEKLCGCIPHFYRPLDSDKICPLSKLQCVRQYTRQIVSLSTNRELKRSLGLPATHRDCGCLSQCEGNVYQKEQENLTPATFQSLRVVISSFPRVRVVRDTIFNIYDILLRSAGVVNLCFGTSIISLVELLLIVLRLIYVVIINKV